MYRGMPLIPREATYLYTPGRHIHHCYTPLYTREAYTPRLYTSQTLRRTPLLYTSQTLRENSDTSAHSPPLFFSPVSLLGRVLSSLIPVSLLGRVLSTTGLMPDLRRVYTSGCIFPFHCWWVLFSLFLTVLRGLSPLFPLHRGLHGGLGENKPGNKGE